jgi:hypothetical protein
MLSETNEDFIRDYEIQSTATFRDFYHIIKETVNLPGNELSSFFLCDSEWNRATEVTLMAMDDDGEDEPSETVHLVMDEVKLVDMMNEPRQRLIYEYDFLKPKTFYLELKGVQKAEAGVDYPLCTYSVGEPEAPVAEEEDDELFDEIEITELDKLLDDLSGEIQGGEEPDDNLF